MATNNQIRLFKFDPKRIAPRSTVYILGKRNTGKSHLLKDLLYYKKDDYPLFTVFSHTAEYNHFYEKLVPRYLINNKYSEERMQEIFDRQERKMNSSNPLAGIVFDDMFEDSAVWKNDRLVKRIFTAGRHFHIGFYLLVQSMNTIPPYGRNNIDYVFILQQQNNNEKTRIYEEFGCGMSKRLFFEILDKVTENYGVLVIDNTSKSNKISERFFGYRAKADCPDYRLCCPAAWRVQDRINRNNYFKNLNSTHISLPTGGTVAIEKFKPRTVKIGDICIFVGKRNSGKSFALRDILFYHKRYFGGGTVMSESENIQHFYSTFVKESLIKHNYSPEIIQKIFDRQTRCVNGGEFPNYFLIFDDMTSDLAKMKKEPLMVKLYKEGRHYKINMYFLFHDAGDIPSYAKTNADFIFILQQNNYQEKDKLYKLYGGMFQKKKDFYHALDKLTDNYGCMVINNKSRSNNIKDRVFSYRATNPPPRFQLLL